MIVAADGTLDPVQHPMVEPEIDCFYVYPTISMDQSLNSDLAPHDEESWVMRNQAAPLSPSCRVVRPDLPTGHDPRASAPRWRERTSTTPARLRTATSSRRGSTTSSTTTAAAA